VSNTHPSGQPQPLGNFYQSQGAACELQSVLDRVNDERLRLLRLLKDCEARFGTAGVIPPSEEIARLTGKVRAIDDAVRQRYNQLRKDEITLDKRTEQMAQLRQGVQELADQFNAQIDQARSIKPDLAAARQTVKDAVDLIVQGALAQLDQARDGASSKLSDFRAAQSTAKDQLREARHEIERAFAEIDDRLAAASGHARDEAQKLIDPIFGQLESHATECGRRVRQIVDATDQATRDKLEQLPDQAEQVLLPVRDTLNNVIEDARAQTASLNSEIQNLDARVLELTDSANAQLQQRLDELPQQADTLLDGLVAQRLEAHKGALDQHESVIQDRLVELDGHLANRFESEQSALNKREATLDERFRELDGHLANRFESEQSALIKREASLDERFKGLDSLLDKHLIEHNQIMEQRELALNKRIDELDELQAKRIDEHEQVMVKHEKTLAAKVQDVYLQKQAELIRTLDEQGNALADRLIAQQQQRIEASVEVLETKRMAIQDEIKRSSQSFTELWDQKAQEADKQADDRVESLLAKLSAKVDHAISDADTRAESIGQQVHGRLIASLDQSYAEAIDTTKRIESQAAEASAVADDKVRHVADAIESNMREQVVQAMSRAESLTDPFNARLHETIANHQKLMDDLAKSAEAELKDKTQAALQEQQRELQKQAELTIADTQGKMRQRVEDLCASSQSMVELIEQQLTRRLKGIEPQTHQAVESIERHLNQRLSQLRDNAQAMVQVVEDQLSKRVADLQPQAVAAAQDAERELSEHMTRIRQEVENVVSPLRRQVIEELGQIADVGKSVRGAIRRDSQDGAGSTEPPVVDARKLATPLQEMASRMGKKAAKLVGTRDEAEKAANKTDGSDPDRKAA